MPVPLKKSAGPTTQDDWSQSSWRAATPGCGEWAGASLAGWHHSAGRQPITPGVLVHHFLIFPLFNFRVDLMEESIYNSLMNTEKVSKFNETTREVEVTDEIIDGTNLSLNEWLKLLFSKKVSRLSPNKCFPTDKMRDEYLSTIHDRKECPFGRCAYGLKKIFF
jgi:hypothetical protein